MVGIIINMKNTDYLENSAQERLERMSERMSARIDTYSRTLVRNAIVRWSGWAAAATVCVVLFFVLYRPSISSELVLSSVAVNTTKTSSRTMLPDGTEVFLAPGAHLSYDVNNYSNRIASLEGEAFFQVAKNKERPFVVKTGSVDIEVLGTAFSVKTASEFSPAEVVLERGSVVLKSPEGVGLVNLLPNQKATVGETVTVEEIKAMAYVTMKYNMVSLLNVTVSEIVQCISDMFDVEVNYTEKRPSNRYDITFLNTDSLSDVINIAETLTKEDINIKTQ